MPYTPYPIAINPLYDLDGSTVIEDVRITAFNTTTGERMPYIGEVTTDSSGQAIIDMANFASGYTTGDKVQIVAFTTKKSVEIRHTIDTTVGSYTATNMILHIGGAYLNDIKVSQITVSNYDTISRYVDLYDRDEPSVLRKRITVPPRNTIPIHFGKDEEFFFKGGVCKDLSVRTANIIFVSIKARKIPY